MHSRSRSWCSTSTDKILLANQRARDDFSVLGEPLEYEGSLFTHPFDLVDEDGQPLELSDIPSVRTLRTGETLSGFVMGVRSSDYHGHGVAHRRHAAAPRRRRHDHRRDLHVLRHHAATTRASRAARVGGAVPAHRRERGRRRLPLHGRRVAALRLREPRGRGRARVHAAGVLRRPVADHQGDPRRRHRRGALARARGCRRGALVAAAHDAARRHADLDRAQGGAAA